MHAKLFLVFLVSIFSIAVSNASVPAQAPASTNAPSGGFFSLYFSNLASTPTPSAPTITCSIDSVIVGFNTTPGPNFLKSRCKNILDILPSLAPVKPGKVLAGFSSTGAQYSDASAGSIDQNCPNGKFIVGITKTGGILCAGPTHLYAWTPSAYSACSVTCGVGTQSRTVVCKRDDGFPVDDSYCEKDPKPATSQACVMPACNQLSVKSNLNAKCGTYKCPITEPYFYGCDFVYMYGGGPMTVVNYGGYPQTIYIQEGGNCKNGSFNATGLRCSTLNLSNSAWQRCPGNSMNWSGF